MKTMCHIRHNNGVWEILTFRFVLLYGQTFPTAGDAYRFAQGENLAVVSINGGEAEVVL